MTRFVLRDSRRLTGPNVIWEKPGPVMDIALDDSDREIAEQTWERYARTLMNALGWEKEETATRHFPGGLSLAFSAPMDVLYAACEVNEIAWAMAEAEIEGTEGPDFDSSVAKWKSEIRKERNPPLLRIQRAAEKRGKLFLTCDDAVSVGAGRWSHTWSVKRLPETGDIDWDKVSSIPTAMVTGTNGKTTTVRLLKAMVDAQGKIPGLSSTDWLRVGDRILDRGDWSGPGGARSILRNDNTDIALLETARGGMLRRGLGLGAGEADVVLITNIAPDHLGEWGIQDLDMLADTKFVIRHAGKSVVLNADDEKSVERADWITQPLTWFSLNPENPVIQAHRACGGTAAIFQKGKLCWIEGNEAQELLSVQEIPITLNGAAQHNIANALGAVAVAKKLGLSDDSIIAGLKNFQSSAKDNPGRLNRFDVDGVQVLVDFAHNPHGLTALLEMTAAMPANRRLVTIGHAGDRDDEAICEVALTAARAGVDHIIIKEQEKDLRGRALGEIPAIMEKALLSNGYPAQQISHAGSELEATDLALEWAQPQDLLLLLTLSQRAEVLARLG
ncbi:MAG: Mur ligase family protein [Planctomycetota bacterium]|jgi:UDP-N-acetylmuramyl tripeptide synthase|nr:Mur ligase family protein [Planctomycetota bacterium]